MRCHNEHILSIHLFQARCQLPKRSGLTAINFIDMLEGTLFGALLDNREAPAKNGLSEDCGQFLATGTDRLGRAVFH